MLHVSGSVTKKVRKLMKGESELVVQWQGSSIERSRPHPFHEWFSAMATKLLEEENCPLD